MNSSTLTLVFWKIKVLKGESLIPKNKGSTNPYCEVVLFDDKGYKIGKPLFTKVAKETLNPNWNETLEL